MHCAGGRVYYDNFNFQPASYNLSLQYQKELEKDRRVLEAQQRDDQEKEKNVSKKPVLMMQT